jgi:hypothetical protein
MLLFTNFTPDTFIASAFALMSRSAFCSTGIVNGSIVYALFHVALGYASAGARITGGAPGMAFALAMAAASRAAAATPSMVRFCDAAKPQAPFTSARTPMPIESVSTTLMICCSRVTTKF